MWHVYGVVGMLSSVCNNMSSEIFISVILVPGNTITISGKHIDIPVALHVYSIEPFGAFGTACDNMSGENLISVVLIPGDYIIPKFSGKHIDIPIAVYIDRID